MEHGKTGTADSRLRPDYKRSIVNLAASLAQALGGEDRGYAPLDQLPRSDLAGRPVILLIIDGLGDNFLQSYPESFLGRHRRTRITSVFPPTTATAVTSFFTGVAPRQHAITGWHTYFRELGAVITILPFMPRFGGSPVSGAGIFPDSLIALPSLLDTLDIRSHVILPHFLMDSDYSRMLSGSALRHGYQNLPEMFHCLQDLAERQRGSLLIAYWPELDSLAHSRGIWSPESAAHFLDLDRHCRDFLAPLVEKGAAVIVSSDHGLIDTSEESVIHLEEHPELASLLTLPLCGEPRCAYCYVRSGEELAFEQYIMERLKHVCTLRKSSQLIEDGYFGTGSTSPKLVERTGEYTLLMKENFIIRDRLLNEKGHRHRGVHGGLTADELYVPLIVL